MSWSFKAPVFLWHIQFEGCRHLYYIIYSYYVLFNNYSFFCDWLKNFPFCPSSFLNNDYIAIIYETSNYKAADNLQWSVWGYRLMLLVTSFQLLQLTVVTCGWYDCVQTTMMSQVPNKWPQSPRSVNCGISTGGPCLCASVSPKHNNCNVTHSSGCLQ